MPETLHRLTLDSEAYPPLLREIAQPPAELFVRGSIERLHHPKLLAVVGSRKPSIYGKQCVRVLFTPALRRGISLVSGLAFGIDVLAHRLCLKHNVPTIAVLGSGVDDASIYPRTHISVAHHILEKGGTLVSEYPPGTTAYQSNFPARNRIIAGLCTATVIVQAMQRSGSLITARLALESNRDVGAVPGPITDPLSEGTNNLIRHGALPITTAQDVLDLFGIEPSEPVPTSVLELTTDQQVVFDTLTHEPRHINDLVTQTNLPLELLSATLVELELAEVAEHVGGMKYIKRVA